MGQNHQNLGIGFGDFSCLKNFLCMEIPCLKKKTQICMPKFMHEFSMHKIFFKHEINLMLKKQLFMHEINLMLKKQLFKHEINLMLKKNLCMGFPCLNFGEIFASDFVAKI